MISRQEKCYITIEICYIIHTFILHFFKWGVAGGIVCRLIVYFIQSKLVLSEIISSCIWLIRRSKCVMVSIP